MYNLLSSFPSFYYAPFLPTQSSSTAPFSSPQRAHEPLDAVIASSSSAIKAFKPAMSLLTVDLSVLDELTTSL